MKLEIVIAPTAATAYDFASMEIVRSNGVSLGQLDVDFRALAALKAPEWAADLLVLATAVYGLDKLVGRSSARDAWTRSFMLKVPVAAPNQWRQQRADLTAALNFLTGDQWQLSFSKRETPVYRPKPGRRRRALARTPQSVCLLSGGLDSLIGAIDHLESNPGSNVLLVGHHDGQMPGPLDDQHSLLAAIRATYPNRTEALLVRVGHSGSSEEITLRSRSLVFIALGMFAASSVDRKLPLLVPENGTMSLNVPLTPSRRGSCSTRTTHPFFIELVGRVVAGLGGNGAIQNPLLFKTKGEAVSQCLNPDLLRTVAQDSVSCAKRGHRRTWKRRRANGCGRCMPCIYRRAALHTVDLDSEAYGRDVCKGEVNIDKRDEEAPNDLRACFSFLKRRHSTRELERLLITSGPLPPQHLQLHAQVVERAMDEIRNLLRDKGTHKIRKQAGVK